MALAPLEVLIYALVIAGKPEPVTCDLKPDKTVVCSNHMSAVEDTRAGGMVFNGTVKVQAARDGRLLFSNGITVMRSSAGWIKFSSGVEAQGRVGRPQHLPRRTRPRVHRNQRDPGRLPPPLNCGRCPA
jgi:hypothetical protein